jgi:hypothetical protein
VIPEVGYYVLEEVLHPHILGYTLSGRGTNQSKQALEQLLRRLVFVEIRSVERNQLEINHALVVRWD